MILISIFFIIFYHFDALRRIKDEFYATFN